MYAFALGWLFRKFATDKCEGDNCWGFRTTDVTGTVELPAGTEMVMPGDNLKFNVELIAPIAMEDGLRFAIREGGRTVGAGVVSKIVE